MANICTNYVFVKDGEVAELIQRLWNENLKTGKGVTFSDILSNINLEADDTYGKNLLLSSVTPIDWDSNKGVLFQVDSKWEAPEELFAIINQKCRALWFAEELGNAYARTNDIDHEFFKDTYLWDDGQSQNTYQTFDELKHEFCIGNDLSYKDYCNINSVDDIKQIIWDNLWNQCVVEATIALDF